MAEKKLQVAIGQYSSAGQKDINQDYASACIPKNNQLYTKGIAVAIADGISSSAVSQIASQTAVNSFIEDYYCTSAAWTVKKSGQQVLGATNSWLYAQTQQSDFRFNKDKGYVCTFSAAVFKSQAAHIFHSGDSRIYKLHDNTLEQLTVDHRRHISETESYLTRGLGIHQHLEADYITTPIVVNDMFVLATDGIYEFVDHLTLTSLLIDADKTQHLDRLAEHIAQVALNNGSDDNLTVQCIRIDHLSPQTINEIHDNVTLLPAKQIAIGDNIDGFEILRSLYVSSRSHVFLARQINNNTKVVIKTPSAEMRENQAHLESFILEDWITKRINNDHIIKAIHTTFEPTFLYTATEYLDGVTLAQWMRDNPQPDLDTVRSIVTQIAKGLQAMHRLEMVHQDLRPNNIMIDEAGTVKIIDLGSAFVAGIDEININQQNTAFFTAQYAAPEYFIGEQGTHQSDIFSLGVLTYQMLSARLPYGNNIAQKNTPKAQQSLHYHSLLTPTSAIPEWVDGCIKKALHIQPHKRYSEISEYIYDLKHPNKKFNTGIKRPLLESHPVFFWQAISGILLVLLILSLIQK